MELMSLLAKLTLDKTEYDKGLEDAEKDAKGLDIPPVKIPKTDNTDFDAGVSEAEETGGVFKEVMNGVWSGIKDGLVTTGIVTTISSIVGWMKQGISLAIDNGKEIADNSKNLQISQKAYQELDYVLEKSNLSMKDLSKTMTTIDKIRSGNISDDQKTYLENLGISAEEAASGMVSAEEMLSTLMGKLAGYEGADKGAIIDAFFGNKKEWTGFFEQSAAEIDSLKEAANNMGLIMSDKSIENAVKFKETVENIQDTFAGLQQSFGESILPMITDAVAGVERVVEFLTADRRTLSQMLGDYDKSYFQDIAEIEGKARQASVLVDKLIAMGDPSKLTEQEFAVWKGTAEAAIALIPSLAEQINVETGSIDGNTASLKANIEQWKELAKQKAMQALYEEKYAAVAEKVKALTDEQVKLNLKESEAADKRQVAIQKANEYLQDEDQGAYRQQLFGMTEVNDSNFAQALMVFSQLEGEAGKAMKEYNNVANEIYGIQDNIKNLTADYEAGMQKYTEWSSAASTVITTLNSDASSATSQAATLRDTVNSIPDEKHIRISIDEDDYQPHAIGSAYIPYDNYPALLHRGERVLTATQARRGEGSGASIDYGHLEDRIAAAIRTGMEGATVRSYLNGRDITQEVNRNNINGIKGRRFAG